MSVRVNERKEGKLQVFNCAKKLVEYTFQICKSDKVIPKSSRWLMANRLINTSLDVLTCIKKANTIPLEKEYASKRKGLQIDAKANLELMLAYIDVAYNVYGIDSQRIEYWTGLVIDTEVKLSNWIKSDTERLK